MEKGTLNRKLLPAMRGVVPPGVSVLAAVSGGPDSTALACMLHLVRKKLRLKRLGIAHVNHGLRGKESDADERFVRRLARRLGVPCFVKLLSGRSLHSAGMEEWARRERYAFFLEVKGREGFDLVATGHSADDQAETVLLRILRGSGIRGLCGILPVREDGVVRPLLSFRRGEIVGWLDARNIPYRIDGSNSDRKFLRNRVRHEVLPVLEKQEPDVRGKLAAIAEKALEIRKIIDPGVERWTGRHVERMKEGFRISREGFSQPLHAAEGVRALFGEYAIPAESRHIERLLAAGSRTSGVYLLPGLWRCLPDRRGVLVCREPGLQQRSFLRRLRVPGVTAVPEARARFTAQVLASPPAELPRDNRTVVLDKNECGTALVFRPLRAGDRFVPLGGSRPVLVRPFLAKQKIDAASRRAAGVVLGKGGRIIWIPGVRIAHSCRVTGETGAVVKIFYQSFPEA